MKARIGKGIFVGVVAVIDRCRPAMGRGVIWLGSGSTRSRTGRWRVRRGYDKTNRDQPRISSLTTACAGLTSLPAGIDASPAPRGIDVRLGL